MSTVRTHAAWFRSALLLGLVQGEEVIAWADATIVREQLHDDALADVSLTAPGDLSALRFALQPLCDAYESPAIAAALFDRVARDLESERRSTADTYALLKQARQMLTLPTEHDAAIRELLVANYLDLHTPGGNDAVHGRIGAWLTQFAGAADRLFSARVYHMVVCERSREAAAFVAAISRWIASPESGVAPDTAFDVWGAPTGERYTVFLDDIALAAAAAQFAPVPVSGTGARPAAAVLLLGEARHPMGVDEAEAIMAHVVGSAR